jgi:large subunit ribosomal protein L7e
MAEEEPKALNYIPEVILKKRKHSEAWALRKKEQLQKKDFQLRKSKDYIKKPEDFILEYRNRVAILPLFSNFMNFAIFWLCL